MRRVGHPAGRHVPSSGVVEAEKQGVTENLGLAGTLCGSRDHPWARDKGEASSAPPEDGGTDGTGGADGSAGDVRQF